MIHLTYYHIPGLHRGMLNLYFAIITESTFNVRSFLIRRN
jgi:hypothetical protein